MTPLQIRLHPRRAARLLQELHEKLRATDDALLLSRASESVLCSLVEARDRDIERLDGQLRQATQVDQAMDTMERKVEEIEEMRHSYERRIAHLRHALEDARAMLRDRHDYDDLSQMTLIDLSAPPPPPTDGIAAGRHDTDDANKPDPAADWLLPLPD